MLLRSLCVVCCVVLFVVRVWCLLVAVCGSLLGVSLFVVRCLLFDV